MVSYSFRFRGRPKHGIGRRLFDSKFIQHHRFHSDPGSTYGSMIVPNCFTTFLRVDMCPCWCRSRQFFWLQIRSKLRIVHRSRGDVWICDGAEMHCVLIANSFFESVYGIHGRADTQCISATTPFKGIDLSVFTRWCLDQWYHRNSMFWF